MNIKINGENKTIDGDSINVTDLLKVEEVKMPDMVSVQLNGEMVERDAFSSTVVKENDEIDFLYFMGGGQR